MRFLIDEDLPRSVGRLLAQHGHTVEDVRDIGLRGTKDADIAAYAQRSGLGLITADAGFANIHVYPPAQYAGIIVIRVPLHATAAFIVALVAPLVEDEALLTSLSGKLAIVEPGRVRVR